jgi:hypothetical protein
MTYDVYDGVRHIGTIIAENLDEAKKIANEQYPAYTEIL